MTVTKRIFSAVTPILAADAMELMVANCCPRSLTTGTTFTFDQGVAKDEVRSPLFPPTPLPPNGRLSWAQQHGRDLNRAGAKWSNDKPRKHPQE